MRQMTQVSATVAEAATCDPITLQIVRGALRAIQSEMEAIIVPPVRVVREGVVVDELLRLFYRNSRFPEMVKGDTRASMAAIRLGERRLAELFQRFGRARTTAAFDRLIAETERELRQKL